MPDDRRLRVDDRDHRRPRCGGGDHERELDRRLLRRLERRRRIEGDEALVVQVDDSHTVGRPDVRDHAARPASRSETNAAARRAAAVGAAPPLRATR